MKWPKFLIIPSRAIYTAIILKTFLCQRDIDGLFGKNSYQECGLTKQIKKVNVKEITK